MSEAVLSQFQQHQTDTGSPQVQVIRLTERINHLTGHFQAHKKDHSSRQGLLRMVNRRRRLLDYLKKNDEQTYRKLLGSLQLRK